MYDIGEYKRIEGSALKIQDERRTEMGILIRGGRIVDAATDTDKTGDIYLVADVRGHSDVNTTRKHYAAIAEDHRRIAAQKTVLREEPVHADLPKP